MSYASLEDLAQAVRVQVTDKNREQLQRCVDAASIEIDHWLGANLLDPDSAAGSPLAAEVCIARGTEYWKASDAIFGVLGFDGAGVLTAPRDGFSRHAATLMPLVQTFGIA